MEMEQLAVVSMSTALAFLFTMEDDEAVLMNSRRRTHKYWMAPYLRERMNPYQRNTLSKLERDFIRVGTHDEFRLTLRMAPDVYAELLKMVTPLLRRQNTNYQMSVSPEERLSITMRYMALGDSTRTLHQAYLVGYSTVQPLIRDTCHALYSVLREEYLRTPTTQEEWPQISDDFERRWNLPHILGSVDGKHVRIRCPRGTGSLYYNYKNYFSLVLMAVVDADYRFIFVDVGAEGHVSDSRVWRETQFFYDIESPDNVLNLPDAAPIRGMKGRLPYFFVGDDAFAMNMHLMKPFPSTNLSFEQRIFNYRLRRCRRIVENAFGILSSRFRILLRQQDMEPEGVKILIMTAVALHHFLSTKSRDTYLSRGSMDQEDRDYNVVPGNWRRQRQLDPVSGHQRVRNYSLFVKNMRKSLAMWCVSRAGEVPWQYKIVPGALQGKEGQ